MSEPVAEQEKSREAVIEEKARKLLENMENERLQKLSDSLDHCVHFVNNTGSFDKSNQNEKSAEEKYRRFLGLGDYHKEDDGSPEAKQKFLLRDFWLQMEGEPEITPEEKTELDKITNDKLLKKQPIINEIIEIALKAQEIGLKEKRGVNDKTNQLEQTHISGVVELCKKVFPNLPLLHLAASVHDSYKYVADKYFELGLHELASAAFGPVLIEQLLFEYQADLGLTNEEITLVVKLIRRAIFTHGKEEFPDQNAKLIEIQEKEATETKIPSILKAKVKQLFQWLYIQTNKESVLDVETINPDNSELTIAAMNFLDALTGTNIDSFSKYNDSYSDEAIADINLLSDYFKNKIFSSFNTNMYMKSSLFLLRFHDPQLMEIVNANIQIKRALDFVLGVELPAQLALDFSETSLKQIKGEFLKLQNIHQKMREVKVILDKLRQDYNNELLMIELHNLRIDFDVQISILFQTAYFAYHNRNKDVDAQQK